MYQALYRKYRPRCFQDVAGQEHVTETLRRQIIGDRLSHAYLFVGTRGTGKTSCAKILSRAVNCLAPVDGEPCNKCMACLGIENGSILDVLELDAASNNGVDNVRALREEAIYTPASVKKRVYIIDEVHMLTGAAFNALLKILEEPPEHLLFILATTELHKVPATILSRCQRFSFKRLSAAAIAARLKLIAKSEGLALTGEAAEKLAALADGSMRDGVSLLDQCASDMTIDLQRVLDTIGLAGQLELLRLAAATARGDIAKALGIFDSLYGDGRDMASLLNELATIMRDLLVFKLSSESPLLSGAFSKKELSGMSKLYTPERLLSNLDVIKEATFGLTRGGSAKLSVEMCLIRLSNERLTPEASTILARVAKLENASRHGSVAMLEEAAAEPVSTAKPDEAAAKPVSAAMLDEAAAEPVSAAKLDEEAASEGEAKLDEAAAKSVNAAKPLEAADLEREAKPTEVAGSQSTARMEDAAPENAAKPKEAAPESTADPESSDPAPETTDFWSEILESLKEDIAVHAVLSDSTNVKAELRDGALVILATSPFTVNTIESKMFSEPLGEAASRVLGRSIPIRVETGVGKVGDARNEKLERLSAFNIIQFE